MTINLGEKHEFYRIELPYIIIEKFDALDEDFFDFVSIKQVLKKELLNTFEGDDEKIKKINEAPLLDEWNNSNTKMHCPMSVSPRDFPFCLEKYLEFSFESVLEEFIDTIDEDTYNKLSKKIINEFLKQVKNK